MQEVHAKALHAALAVPSKPPSVLSGETIQLRTSHQATQATLQVLTAAEARDGTAGSGPAVGVAMFLMSIRVPRLPYPPFP